MCDTDLLYDLWNGVSESIVCDTMRSPYGEMMVVNDSIDDSYQTHTGPVHTTNSAQSSEYKSEERKRKNRISAQQSRTKQKHKMTDLQNQVEKGGLMIDEQAKLISSLEERIALLTNENEALRKKITEIEAVSTTQK